MAVDEDALAGAHLAEDVGGGEAPVDGGLRCGVVPADAAASCKFCKSRRKMQDKVISEFQTRFRRRPLEVFVAPQQPHEMKRANDLLGHFQAWQNVASFKKQK